MNLNWIKCATVPSLSLVESLPARSATISFEVDPGVVGQVAGNLLNVNLFELTGLQLPANETLIEIQFTDSKYVTVSNLTIGDVFRYYIFGGYSPASPTMGVADGGDGEYLNEYHLTSDNGQQFDSWDYVTVGGQGGNIGVLVEHGQFVLELDSVRIRSLRLAFDASQSFQFTDAILSLQLNGGGQLEIGILPEPSTVAPMCCAAIVLAIATRRRTSTQSFWFATVEKG